MRRSLPLAIPVVVLLVLGTTYGDEPKIVDDAGLFPKDARLEELWNDGEFTEGVAVAADGTVFFSDIAFKVENPGRVMTFDPGTGKVSVHCEDSGKSNGLFFAPDGRLLAACGANAGARGVCEITPDGKLRKLFERWNGKRFNAPNDLVVLADGTIFVSDPKYVGPEPMEIDHMSVYRIATDGTVTRATTDVEKPNGVNVSPDGRTLYVAETNNGSTDVTKQDPTTKKGRMTLNAFPIRKHGTLGEKRVLVDFGKATGVDGMTVDSKGRIYAAVRDADRFGVRVFSPDGKELAYLPTPALPTNCCFGRGKTSNVLYVTAGIGLYRIRTNVTGSHPTAD